MNRPRRPRINRGSKAASNQYVTKNGTKIKLHRSLKSKVRQKRDARSRAKAAYLATLPKNPFQRVMYRMHPKRVAKYWLSRDGRIMSLKLTGIGLLAVFLMLVGVFAYFRKDLPDLKGLYGSNTGGSIRYYDRSGKTLLWEDYDAVKRNIVKDEDIPEIMEKATVSLEDKDFFTHGGFDLQGISRAAYNNITNRESTQGGSTITQQLVKLSQNWSKDRTYTRKIKELILAVELERTYSKQEILTGYLNTAPYSDIAYGVEAAMQDYFGKNSSKMSLDEAAFLAAIPKSPTLYSPYGARYDPESLTGRQDYVLDLMAEQGKITGEERDAAKNINTLKKIKPRKPKYQGIKAPWFVLAAKENLQTKYGSDTVLRGGWKVTTTVDMAKQKIAEEEVDRGMFRVYAAGGDVSAFVLENVETGQVEALVGGSDFRNKEYGENNYARLKLPPGSSFKPYDYLALIENSDRYGAGTVLYDTVEPVDGYPCTNRARPPAGNCLYDYDFRAPGPVTLRYALGGSRNIPAVKAMAITGVEKTIDTANKLGLKDTGDDRIEGHGYKCYQDDELTKEAPCYTSSSIGDGAYLKLDEHVHGFSTISRNGRLIPQTYILKIEQANGKVLPDSVWKPSEGKQAVRDESAYIVADMMSDTRASYFPNKSQLYNGHKFSMKTGTTNDSKDGWMMGFSTQYAAGVWVGYHNRQRELAGFMETMTQPIWDGVMRRIHNELQPKERSRPKGIQELPAFVVRAHVGVGSVEPSPSNDLYPSWYRKKGPGGSQTIDKVSKKIATNCTPTRARENVFNGVANQFSADPFHGDIVSSSEKDDTHKCEDAKPRITLTAPSSCDRRCTFTATISQGTHPISSGQFQGTINFYVDGQLIKSAGVGSSPATVSASYSVATSGRREVKAEVIDSVLYDSSDSRSVNFKKPIAAPSNLKITSADKTGLFISASWSGGAGTVTIYRVDNNHPICNAPADTGTCSGGVGPDPGDAEFVYAKDSDGNTSSQFELD